MILKEDQYFNIIHVLVESATSGDEEFGFATVMDDIKPSFVGEWTPTNSEYDKSRVIEEFNTYNPDNALNDENLEKLEARQSFYPVDENYFVGGLDLEKPTYLGMRDYRLPTFEFDGETFENFLLPTDFDLFYKEGDEYIQVKFN